MGKFIEVPVSMTRPIQVTLERRELGDLLRLYDSDKFSNLFPCIAKEFKTGEYLVINGTHRNFIYSILDLDSKLYVPENKTDLISSENFPNVPLEYINDANSSIRCVFDVAEGYCLGAEGNGVKSFDDLKELYKIYTLNDVKRFVEGSIPNPFTNR